MHDHIWFQEYRKVALLCNHQDTIVYLAQHVKLLDKFVIKQVKKNSAAYQQVLMEAKLLQILQHPCIPTLYHVYDEQDSLYIVEQYMRGESLKSICQSELLSISTILSFSIQLCDLILFLHSQSNPILYLDLNPSNILINQTRLALIDFGASMYKRNASHTSSHYGTVGFAAPEQFKNNGLDERTDIYGLGCIMDYLLQQIQEADRVTYQEEYKALMRVIDKCRKQKKSQRYSNVQQVGSLLSHIFYQVGRKKGKELLIAVAGTQNHIGATHASLLLCSYLKKHGKECLYVECNHTGAAKLLIQKAGILNCEAVYEYEHIPMLPSVNYGSIQYHQRSNTVIVVDYGVLSEDNILGFEDSDLHFLVYGAKVYEWPPLEQCLKRMTSFRNTYFLKNYQTAIESKEIYEMIPKEQCITLPYEPQLGHLNSAKLEKSLAKLLQPYL